MIVPYLLSSPTLKKRNQLTNRPLHSAQEHEYLRKCISLEGRTQSFGTYIAISEPTPPFPVIRLFLVSGTLIPPFYYSHSTHHQEAWPSTFPLYPSRSENIAPRNSSQNPHQLHNIFLRSRKSPLEQLKGVHDTAGAKKTRNRIRAPRLMTVLQSKTRPRSLVDPEMRLTPYAGGRSGGFIIAGIQAYVRATVLRKEM